MRQRLWPLVVLLLGVGTGAYVIHAMLQDERHGARNAIDLMDGHGDLVGPLPVFDPPSNIRPALEAPKLFAVSQDDTIDLRKKWAFEITPSHWQVFDTVGGSAWMMTRCPDPPFTCLEIDHQPVHVLTEKEYQDVKALLRKVDHSWLWE